MKLRIRDRKATVPEKETAWKSDNKWQSYRRRREDERKWAFSASLRRFPSKTMKSRIRDRKATVLEKETAWKSDNKWQSYRRRREDERKWAFSASLRRFPSKTMKSRIRDRKATVLEKETAWKSDHKWQSYRRRREHERKWAFSASLRRFPSKTMKSRIRDRKATVLEKETAWKSDHKWQSYRRRREHERKWAFSASLRRFPSKTMKSRIRDRKATVLEKETAWKSDHKWQSYRGRREHEQNWLFVTMSIKDEEEHHITELMLLEDFKWNQVQSKT